MANLSWISSNPDYINQMIRNTQVTLSNNYNDLDNIPIIKITSTTNNPQKIWGLKEGLYMIDGVVQVDNNTSYEVSNLLISMTARLENGKYILSAFIPYLRGLFEYILKTNSTEYEQHQKIVLMIKNDTLALDNETIYTPIEDYHPATKKYVDDKANEIVTELDRMGVNKENLESLSKENRIRDIKLQALLSETSDRNITIEENVRYFDMPLSIDNGIVTINEIVGETLVNVCDQEESVAITKSYTVENENHIALQGEYDGSCRPVVYGNTLVNHNADWDGKIQTGIETSASGIEDVQVEGIKGQEVSVVVEGNTVLNHALGKTASVVTDIEDSISMPSRDITLQGNSSVNNGVYAIVKNYSLFKPSTIYTFIYEVKNCTTTNDLTLFASSLTVATTSVSLNTSVGKHTVTFTTKDILDSSITHGLYIHLTGSNATVDTSNQLVLCNMLVLEGDHTTNPKYINSNEGNYVDLTVANDMSSVVEIEGRTMVNVCDQKEPIAITKSYTVENSGNHIALQGEYDGKCRPVIQGNTMVNLFDYTKLTNFSSNGKQLEIIKNGIKLTLNEGNYYLGISTMDYTNNMLKPNTTYTFLWNYKHISGNDNHKVSVGYTTTTSNYAKEVTTQANSSLGTLVFTTDLLGTDDYIGISFRFLRTSNASSEITIGEYTNLMLFEGDLTQTPELIPTEYVEGLKNSFEDGYIPSENLWNINELLKADVGEATTITNNSIKINNPKSWTKVGLKLYNTLNKTYTLAVKIEGNPRVYYRTTHELTTTGEVIIVEDNINKFYLKKIQFNTDNSLICFEGVSNNVVNYNDIVILEGDWTHLTEEDFNHLGKYKVEYKVTGKNKFNEDDIRYVGQIYSDTGTPYDNENYNIGGYIECNKKQYILSGTTTDDLNYNGDYIVEFNENKEFIKRTYMTSGLINLGDTTKYISICPYITSKNIQLEEGSTATEYEPYKSYTKTFYLNSPLLEGDTIEDINGVATHVKRSGMVVLDGSEYWDILGTNVPFGSYKLPLKPNGNMTSTEHGAFCDNFPLNTIVSNDINDTRKGVYVVGGGSYSNLRIRITDTDTQNSIKEYLQANPTTVVYQLASPQYETISTESILCDSYVNGHLDFDSAVPIEKVKFSYWTKYLTYVKDNTAYTLQFESDNTGYVDWLSIGGTALHNISVTKGINKVLITTPIDNNRIVGIVGIGFNASNIVVTEATDIDFDYFEGLKSSYEYEVTEDGKYKVDVKVTGKNKIGILERGYINSKNGISDDSADQLKKSMRTKYIKVDYNKDYHLSNLYSSCSFFVAFYDKNKNYLGRSYAVLAGDTTINKTYAKVYDVNEPYSYIRITNYGRITDDMFLNNTLQLEEGTVATSYEPYFESAKTFYLNSPLLEGDKIVTKNGKVYHYHKMGKVVLDGSEDWFTYQTTSGVPYATKSISDMIIDKVNTAVLIQCDTLLTKSSVELWETNPPSNCISSAFDSNQIRIMLSNCNNSETIVSNVKTWLQSNPTTVVYELDTPYYELIDEYNNTILNIPKNVAHLTHTSTVPVNNTVFTNYKDELNVLEANTQYRVMFDCDKANVPFTVTLGGTSQEVTSKNGTHSLLMTTPSTLVDKNLVIDGIGRCGIDNIRIFKGDVEYDYVKGLWSGYEERKLENLLSYNENDWTTNTYKLTYTINEGIFDMQLGDNIGFMFNARNNTIKNLKPNSIYTLVIDILNDSDLFKTQTDYSPVYIPGNNSQNKLDSDTVYIDFSTKGVKSYLLKSNKDFSNKQRDLYIYFADTTVNSRIKFRMYLLEGDWTDNPPTYEEVMANEGKYAVKVKLDTNATIFGKGGRL